jgi:hypothetical protein
MSHRNPKSWFVLCIVVFVLFAGCTQVQKVNLKDAVPECQGQTQKDQVICRGLGWLFANPADIQKDGFLELGEEVNLFYKFYLRGDNKQEKAFFKSVIESKVDYLLREHDLIVDFAGEITGYLAFAKIMKRLDIKRPRYDKFIKDEILTNPMTYPPNATYMILNSALIEDIGYQPKMPFGNLVSQGVIARFSKNPELVPIGKAYASADDIQNFYYDITHEIFAVSNFGDRDPGQYLLDDEIQFLKRIIPQGVTLYVEKGELDILAELIVCSKMLNHTDYHSYETGVQYILDAQKEDGSFGIIHRMEFLKRPNLYRHGVLTAMWALI